VLGFWFLMQLLFATISFSAQAAGRAESGGPAWFVHIGGFLAGILLLLMLRPRRSTRL
jgi:membrane associated rhomboid family serine protease